ncbi:MAG: hypothetical protein ACR2OC_09425 [Solirubrobacterales bacterium]
MNVRWVLVVAGLVSAASLALASTASAGNQAPLTGETLFENFPACVKTSPSIDGPGCEAALLNPPPPRSEGTCNPNGESHLTFTVSGAASGPYPGTFTETGVLTIGPHDQAPVPEGHPIFSPGTAPLPSAEVVSWDADFRIESGDYTITGHKSLSGPATQAADHGLCFDFLDSNAGGLFPGQVTGTSRQAFTSELEYTATIHGPGGTDRDSGASRSVFRDRFLYSASPAGDRVRAIAGLFGEDFTSDQGAEGAKPGKGCGDKNHEHVREAECKKTPR